MTAILGNIIASLLVIALVALAVHNLRSDKSGCCSSGGCGGSCAGCSGCCAHANAKTVQQLK